MGATALVTVGVSAVTKSEAAETPMNEPKERVLGIGGLFFRSRDPKALSEWYQQHLGIDPTPTQHNHTVWTQAAGPTVFAPFPVDTDYFGSPQQAWMVNFRVRDLDAMAAQLRAADIAVKIYSEKDPSGRFARLHDPEGNPIELWEPAAGDSPRT
jgi:predicted enzyme related to lactoylglutathione lyase